MRDVAARKNGNSGKARRPALLLLFGLVWASLLACSPDGGALRPSLGSGGGGSGGGSPGRSGAGLLPGGGGSDGGSPDGGSPDGGGSDAAPVHPRPLLLEPIVEERSSGSGPALGEEDLRSLGELSILPHVVQSISSGAPCDFKDAMSNCQ